MSLVAFLPLLGFIALLIVLARLIAAAAPKDAHAAETDGQIEFAPPRRSFWAMYLFLACLGYVTVAGLILGFKSSSSFVVPVLCLGFIALLLMAFPGSI